ncbi:bile acid:sodium symporter family protein [Pusillimonas sp. NJUB218]|uniref:bile acid:sodium symporter family protein n=1 Tax=Pusillimonas sp. NJUB218 TaxID=2023230 RepID=UPI000F4B8D03|nr:bile acid:sodium symporter family protein [Pusillimonas sp. NJUB218]ROT46392.1 bile acid:sodium symporter [Pusillimonas sp. NJUB218]
MKRIPFLPDTYTFLLVGTVLLASVMPAAGQFAVVLKYTTVAAIALLFFLHGAKLPRQAIIDGLTHWRLHGLILCCTFVFFPLMGFALRPVLLPLVNAELYLGVLYLCMLPATVQSAVALTGIAGGNVPAAVCSASASTLLGILITPFLVNGLIAPTTGAASPIDSVLNIFAQLMLPFLAGHFLRPYFDTAFRKSAKVLSFVDRGSILLVIYSAFSAAVIGGIWQQVSSAMVVGLVVISLVLLFLSMAFVYGLASCFGFNREDRITALFGGAQKSLATGVPMSQVLFTASIAGVMVLPLMLFHLLQLVVSSMLAQRWHRQRRLGQLKT